MKLLVSALERSANVHLSYLTPYLQDVELVGIFDQNLGRPIIDLQSFAVMGFVDVFKKIPFFHKLQNQMIELANEADKVLLMDSSAFNIPLAKKIKKRYPNKEVIYYILPQVWAWRQKRAITLANSVDTLCSTLPFEKQFYPSNANITYVGHPLLDQIKTFKTKPTQNGVIAFLPGSRASEIKNLMPLFKEVRKALAPKESLLVVPPHFMDKIDTLYGDINGFRIVDDSHQALYQAEFAYICSGTATLEATLIGTPFVLTYKAKKIDFFLAKHLVRLQYAGISNILAQFLHIDPVHPELLQEDLNLQNLLKAYNEYNKELFFQKAQQIQDYLVSGSAKNIAKIIRS